MAQPNIEIGSITRILGDTRTDGTMLLPQGYGRSNPMQSMIQGGALGQLIINSANDGTLGACGANTCQANSVTITGLITTDFIMAVAKPAANVGIAITSQWANAANTATINIANPTAGSVTPTASEALNFAVMRGMNTVTTSATVTPAPFVANTNAPGMYEQVFTLGGSGAVVTPVVNALGQITNYTVVTQGVQYTTAPTVQITPNAGYAGFGATAVAVISSNAVVSVVPTSFGSGYTSGQVTITLIGGNSISTGMIAQVNPTAAPVANSAIGNVRVIANNQIGVTLFSTSTANVTPTAANYTFLALNEVPAIKSISYVGFTAAANFANVAANISTVFNVPTPGVALTDIAYAALPPAAAYTANLLIAQSFANAANNLNVVFAGAGVSAVTTPAGVYTIPVQRQQPAAPVTVFDLFLTPASCAANTATEQTFTMPANITLQTLEPVLVNYQSYTQGVTISTNGRVASTTTLSITFINNTTGAITPAPAWFRIGLFPCLIPTLSVSVTASSYSQAVGLTTNQLVDLQNELQQTLMLGGVIKGA